MIPLLKGVYLLFFRLPPAEISVGMLGKQIFPAGTYVYVGSGMGGVLARVKRHLCGSKSKRWHIDYVLAEASEKEAVIYETDDKSMECRLSSMIAALPGSDPVVRGLGSSDCSCVTHLYRMSSVDSARSIVLEGCRKSVFLDSRSPALRDPSQILWQKDIQM